MYAIFECSSCAHRWPDTLPPVWSDYWPSCTACSSESLLESAREAAEAPPTRAKLMWLLADRDCGFVKDWGKSAGDWVLIEPTAKGPQHEPTRRKSTLLALVPLQALPLALVIPGLLLHF